MILTLRVKLCHPPTGRSEDRVLGTVVPYQQHTVSGVIHPGFLYAPDTRAFASYWKTSSSVHEVLSRFSLLRDVFNLTVSVGEEAICKGTYSFIISLA